MYVTLVLPTKEYKDKIIKYKATFIKDGDSMDGTSGLRDAETFEAWYTQWQNNLSEDTVREGLVPSTTFLAIDENDNLLGMIDIRHRLNEHLMNVGGHIGYSVIKQHRQKGIATKMLALALLECEKLNIYNVLITCDKSNIASAKTIIKNGGILENEVMESNRTTQRYWIGI